jgi:hypothetical protein
VARACAGWLIRCALPGCARRVLCRRHHCLYVLTFILGAWIYTQYRFTARLALEQLRFFKTVGIFELKEHLATIGLILPPAYWAYWRQPLSPEYTDARRSVTLLLAVLVWSNFLIGHIVNNARGMGS